MLPILHQPKRTKGHILIAAAFFVVAICLMVIVGAEVWYDHSLTPVSNVATETKVTIAAGSSQAQIADLLKKEGLIRSSTAFNVYVRLKKLQSSLKAGVYVIRPNQTTPEIAAIIAEGREAADQFTIIPGVRLDQIRDKFIKKGFLAADVDAALQPAQYAAHPALAGKPVAASLEGYLYPETFQISPSTTPRQIIGLALDEMAKRLTVARLSAYQSQNLNTFQAITLASIIEEEVQLPADKAMVAQIFLKRLREGIALGSDVTYMYAADITGQVASPDLDNPYNTRKYSGLPPGPISNVSESSLEAVAHPANTDYLFFITGDDGKAYYGKNQADHEQNIKLYCQKTCGH